MSFQIKEDRYQEEYSDDGYLIGCCSEAGEHASCDDCIYQGRCPAEVE
jgi:hypothetical protein